MSSSSVHGERLALGEAAVLSLERAARLLGGRAALARRWIRDHVDVLQGPAGDCVVWGDVLAALRRTSSSTGDLRSAPDRRPARLVRIPAGLTPDPL